ncbi:MerR family transcriptional regulator [Paenibacillus donghaensis]|uniref:MerR family transcriptional regulator n=1 Tax=Paenibacillus donghaensis TaxID=414771 RepID=UPI00188469C2|nr:MerR family transcriptional regulator [Paenibacillus donghaensis]MBE9914507.1 MerR family transcriptional regulator [Paenibacillus donghaensis]
MEKYYSIGEVSKLTGATVKTIRYYDDIHLLSASHVSEAGYRYYNQEDIWQLELILFLRYLGFKINEIKQMLHHELPVSTSIKWQIEAIQHQLDHLERMKRILIQADQQHQPESQLQFLHDISEIIHKSSRKRKDFIAEKMHHAFVEPELSPDWREQMLAAYIDFTPEQQDLTEIQLAAWTRMKAMLSDTTFTAEIRQKLSPFWEAVRQHHIDASPWQAKYKQVTDAVISLMQKGASEQSPEMHRAALDYISLFQNADVQLNLEQLRLFIEQANRMTSARIQEWWELVVTLNPSLVPFFDSQTMIRRTVEWLIANPEHINLRGER